MHIIHSILNQPIWWLTVKQYHDPGHCGFVNPACLPDNELVLSFIVSISHTEKLYS